MPISWGVHHAARLVSATGKGMLSRTDIETYLDDLASAATLSYRKVFHMDGCRLALSNDDLTAIRDRIRRHEAVGSMGRVAIVAPTEELAAQARVFEAAVVAERPLRIFRDAEAAYDWLTAEVEDGVELAETWQLARQRAAA